MMLNVHPAIHLKHTPEFRIHLENSHIIFHGETQDSVGAFLRGRIILNCQEQTKVKSVFLRFIGTTNVHWTEGVGSHSKNCKAEKTIIEKEYVFLEQKKKPYSLSHGKYKWNFEIPLPGNLPESVHHEMGNIQYHLKAYCDRPTFSKKYIDKKTITISRQASPSNLELIQSVLISNIWPEKVSYDISMPRKVYSPGKSVPLTFDLLPIANHLTVHSISCTMKEYTVCSTTPDQRITTSRVIHHVEDNHISFQPYTGHWVKTELLYIPPIETNHVNFDVSNELIQIKHKIKFTVALQNEDGHISELRAAIPVVIAPMAPEEDGNFLPAYEEALRSVPYTAETTARLIDTGEIHYYATTAMLSPPTMSDSHSTLSSSESEEDEPESLPWRGVNISRVPSYATALRTSGHSCQIPSELPTYDSIAIV